MYIVFTSGHSSLYTSIIFYRKEQIQKTKLVILEQKKWIQLLK